MIWLEMKVGSVKAAEMRFSISIVGGSCKSARKLRSLIRHRRAIKLILERARCDRKFSWKSWAGTRSALL
jgi:hypothetical protein